MRSPGPSIDRRGAGNLDERPFGSRPPVTAAASTAAPFPRSPRPRQFPQRLRVVAERAELHRAGALFAGAGGSASDLLHANHICLVYERAAEARAAVAGFFAAGLATGERCLYHGGAASWRRIERALASHRFAPDTGSHLAPGAGGAGIGDGALGPPGPLEPLEPLDSLGEFTAPRGGGPRAWLTAVRDAERQALADGFAGLRVSWEMPPPAEPGRLPEPGDPPESVALEELLDGALPGGNTILLCRYSRQRTSAALLQEVLRRHPAAMLGGEAGASVFYEPPRTAAGAAGIEEGVRRMLLQLRRELRRDRRLRDLERRLAERAAELERAGQEREQLLAMLAHELRNPLSAVSVALSVLRQRGRQGEADETWQRALAAAERQVFHEAALVDDLIEAARATHGELDLHRAPLDLARLVPEVVDAYREAVREAGLELDAELPREALPVSGDRLRLWQAVAHLLQNALKFSHAGGRVRVRLRRAADGRAEISVRDSGIGIAPDLLPHVFEVFSQADHTMNRAKGGLGVGLAVVKGVIERHGGEVRASSAGEAGKGSEFKLLLPLDSAAMDDDRRGGGGWQPAAASGGRRVLVVEDNQDTAETLRDFLELSGFEVEIAGSGGEGVATAHRFLPEIVLCDLGLPGMNGFEVASALRRDPATAAARLIALTGYGGDEDRRRSREAGFDLHLTKPVDPDLLRRLLTA